MSQFLLLTEPDGDQFYVRGGAIDIIEPAPDAHEVGHHRDAKTLVTIGGSPRAVREEEFAVLAAIAKAAA